MTGYKRAVSCLSSVVVVLVTAVAVRERTLAERIRAVHYMVQACNNGSQLCERLGRLGLEDTNVTKVAMCLRQLTPWAAPPPWGDPPQSAESTERYAYDMMDRVRMHNQRDVIAHLRALTGEDLGDDAKAWIERYAKSEAPQ